MTSGHSKLLSQFPRTRTTGGPIDRNSSRTVSAQTSPRCQISSALFAISFTLSGRRLCVSARTNTRRASPAFALIVMLRFELSTRSTSEEYRRGQDDNTVRAAARLGSPSPNGRLAELLEDKLVGKATLGASMTNIRGSSEHPAVIGRLAYVCRMRGAVLPLQGDLAAVRLVFAMR